MSSGSRVINGVVTTGIPANRNDRIFLTMTSDGFQPAYFSLSRNDLHDRVSLAVVEGFHHDPVVYGDPVLLPTC